MTAPTRQSRPGDAGRTGVRRARARPRGPRPFPHPAPPPRRGPLARGVALAAAALRTVFALGALAGLLAGLPAVLVMAAGWPLPHTVPGWQTVEEILTAPGLPDELLVHTLACLGWLCWVLLTLSAVVELAAVVRRVPTPRLPGLSPAQALIGALVGLLSLAPVMMRPPVALPDRTLVVTSSAGNATDEDARTGGTRTLAARSDPPDPGDPLAAGHVVLIVGQVAHRHPVQPGDTLWDIAEAWLGDPHRWPEIYQLNAGQDFPGAGGTLRDPDLIYPGWTLELPDDAVPPGDATASPASPTSDASDASDGEGRTAPVAPPRSSGRPGGPARPDPASITAPSVTSPTGSRPTAPAPPATAAVGPNPQTARPGAPDAPGAPTTADDVRASTDTARPHGPAPTGPPQAASPPAAPATPAAPPGPAPGSARPVETVDVPGGRIGLLLAAALAGAGALAWRRRRRHYRIDDVRLDAATADGRTDDNDGDDGDDGDDVGHGNGDRDGDRDGDDGQGFAPLPSVIVAARREVRRLAPDLLRPRTDDVTAGQAARARRTSTPLPPPPPSGPEGPQLAGLPDGIPAEGLALTGAGAPAAARALLVATLASGSPDDGDAQGQVITTRALWRDLLITPDETTSHPDAGDQDSGRTNRGHADTGGAGTSGAADTDDPADPVPVESVLVESVPVDPVPLDPGQVVNTPSPRPHPPTTGRPSTEDGSRHPGPATRATSDDPSGDPVAAGSIPRLSVAADLDEALSDLEQRLVARRRLLLDAEAGDVAAYRSDPDHEPLPLVLLLAPPPEPGQSDRLAAAARLGSTLGIRTVVVGTWPQARPATVSPDGSTMPGPAPSARSDAPLPPRVAVLDPRAAADVLQTLSRSARSPSLPTTGPRLTPGAPLPASTGDSAVTSSNGSSNGLSNGSSTSSTTFSVSVSTQDSTSRTDAGTAVSEPGEPGEPARSIRPLPSPARLEPLLPCPAPEPVEPVERVESVEQGRRRTAADEGSAADISPSVSTGPHSDRGPHAGPPPAPMASSPTASRVSAAGGTARTTGRSAGRAQLRVMGSPAILQADGTTVPSVREAAIELMTYLAVHRKGASLDAIKEALYGDATRERARQRLSTDVANLRARIRQARGTYPTDVPPGPGGDTRSAGDTGSPDAFADPVVNTGGRYHLNPDLVDVDWWRVQDAAAHAKNATNAPSKAVALQAALAAYAGPLADDRDFDWIARDREATRRLGVALNAHLAALVAGTDPTHAADLLEAACDLDPHNEDVARRALHAHARTGNTDAVRTRLRRLRAALDELDDTPDEDTEALAKRLLTATGRGPSGPRPSPARARARRPSGPTGTPATP